MLLRLKCFSLGVLCSKMFSLGSFSSCLIRTLNYYCPSYTLVHFRSKPLITIFYSHVYEGDGDVGKFFPDSVIIIDEAHGLTGEAKLKTNKEDTEKGKKWVPSRKKDLSGVS